MVHNFNNFGQWLVLIALESSYENTGFCHLSIRQWQILIHHLAHGSYHKGNWQIRGAPIFCEIFRECFSFDFPSLSVYQHLGSVMTYSPV